MNGLAIDASNVTRRFGPVVALDGADFQVASGEVFGLLGPNGAGKTTAVRVLNGLIEPSESERIAVLGHEIDGDIQSVRPLVGVQTESNLYERLSALDNCRLFGSLYNLTPDDAARRAQELLAQFDLVDRAADKVETFSKGMRQKLSIARALMGDPVLIYLDEPTAGLDPEASFELLRYIKDVSADRSKTFFITSHRLEEMESICDTVAILVRGRIRAKGSPAELIAMATDGCRVRVDLGRANGGGALNVDALIGGLSFVRAFERTDSGLLIEIEERKQIPELVRKLGQLELDVYGVVEESLTLQQAYLALVREGRE